jgi:hypothetical protein
MHDRVREFFDSVDKKPSVVKFVRSRPAQKKADGVLDLQGTRLTPRCCPVFAANLLNLRYFLVSV